MVYCNAIISSPLKVDIESVKRDSVTRFCKLGVCSSNYSSFCLAISVFGYFSRSYSNSKGLWIDGSRRAAAGLKGTESQDF